MPSLPLLRASEVAIHNSPKDCWVTLYNRKVYNVTPFLDEHPGGAELITDYAGRDITAIMADLVSHEHSESAYEIMDDAYLVGYVATKYEEEELLNNRYGKPVEVTINEGTESTYNFHDELPPEEVMSIKTDFEEDHVKHKFLDLGKPLLMQVLFANWTRDFYIDQVHRPRHYGKGSAPLFGNFLEPISLTPWWIVPLVWLPPNLFITYLGASQLPWLTSFSYWCLGLFVWTLVEYSLHRFLFHLDNNLPEHNAFFALHFLLHGVHHYLPMDGYRLVLPPTLFVVLAYPFYKLIFSLLPYHIACVGFGGGTLGYICYDVCHYIFHHSKLPDFLQRQKTIHLEHHYKNYQLGFGVTSQFWDVVFGTTITETFQKNS